MYAVIEELDWAYINGIGNEGWFEDLSDIGGIEITGDWEDYPNLGIKAVSAVDWAGNPYYVIEG